MIDEVDAQITEWASGVLDGAEISLAAPAASATGKGASFYLLALDEAPALRSMQRTPLQMSLRYLVTTWAEEPPEAHRLLGTLAFAAMEEPDFEVELQPVAQGVWSGLGIPPQPAFILRLPLRKERPEPETPRVRHPLTVKQVAMTTLHGVVLGPGDVPISNATVEIPALQLITRSDAHGRFRFHRVPQLSEIAAGLEVVARAKGSRVSVQLEAIPDPAAPLELRFEFS